MQAFLLHIFRICLNDTISWLQCKTQLFPKSSILGHAIWNPILLSWNCLWKYLCHIATPWLSKELDAPCWSLAILSLSPELQKFSSAVIYRNVFSFTKHTLFRAFWQSMHGVALGFPSSCFGCLCWVSVVSREAPSVGNLPHLEVGAELSPGSFCLSTDLWTL